MPSKIKEWRMELKNGKVVEIQGKKFFKPFSGYVISLQYFIETALKAQREETLKEAISYSFGDPTYGTIVKIKYIKKLLDKLK